MSVCMQKNCLSFQGKHLIEKIIQSPALQGITEAMSYRASMSLWDHADRMHQWLQITRVFYLTGQQLLTNISLALNRAYIEKDIPTIQRLEIIRAKVDAVLADDGGHCRTLQGAEKLPWFERSHERVHYEMFDGDIARPLQEVSWNMDITIRPDTWALMEAMEKGFAKSIEEGFSWILIVELIAEEIVTKMLPYLTKIKKDNQSFFSREQLFYCTYHMLLEKLHAGDVKEGITLVADTSERFQLLQTEVLDALKLWESFWLSQAKIGE